MPSGGVSRGVRQARKTADEGDVRIWATENDFCDVVCSRCVLGVVFLEDARPRGVRWVDVDGVVVVAVVSFLLRCCCRFGLLLVFFV